MYKLTKRRLTPKQEQLLLSYRQFGQVARNLPEEVNLWTLAQDMHALRQLAKRHDSLCVAQCNGFKTEKEEADNEKRQRGTEEAIVNILRVYAPGGVGSFQAHLDNPPLHLLEEKATLIKVQYDPRGMTIKIWIAGVDITAFLLV
jgi:hypothetical protein